MKTYSLKQIQAVVNWVQPRQVLKLLADNGVHPASELQLGARVYRQFDAAAMKRVKELKREHLQRLNGRSGVEHTEPEPQPAAAESDQLDRMAVVIAGIASRVAALTTAAQRIDEAHAKLDSLHDKIDRLAAMWDDTPESINESFGGVQ